MTHRKAPRFIKEAIGGIPFLCVQNACGYKGEQQPTQEPTHASFTAERFAVQVDFQTFCARLEIVRKYSVRQQARKKLLVDKKIKFMKLKEILCVGAMVNTFDSDKIGFQLTVCQQTVWKWNREESWFDARQVALFSFVLKLFQRTTCLCSSVSTTPC